MVTDLFFSFFRPKKQTKKRGCSPGGEVKIEPDDVIYVIMTDKDMFKYQSKDVFEEALEKFNADESLAFCKGQVFSSFDEAAVAYETLMDHYNGLSEEEKVKFQADTVDLESMENDAKKKPAASPTKKIANG